MSFKQSRSDRSDRTRSSNAANRRFHSSRTNIENVRSKLTYDSLEPRQMLAADFGAATSTQLNPNIDTISTSQDGQWRALDPNVVARQSGEQLLNLTSFAVYDLQEQVFASAVKNAPMEFAPNFETLAKTISIPKPDNTFARFKIVKSPIMAPALAARFPGIMTYRGIGIDDPAAALRFDQTMHGFHAQVLTPNGNYYVDPVFKGQTGLYASYYGSDLLPAADRLQEQWNEVLVGESELTAGAGGESVPGTSVERSANSDDPSGGGNAPPFGTQLRTFRLAVAATGEYTAYWGGTVAAGQAAIVTAVNRVTGVYEKDLGIRMVLVANNSNLVYTNSSTDPYTNNDGVAMLSQNQSTINSVIGSANYDIGHVFSTGGGGVAGLGVVGKTNTKARGVTGSSSPTGDAFFIDYVAHEMGHQFGANHTFNSITSSCGGGNRNGSTAYEPGSGATIMAYAGICGSDNLQSNSDAVFHSGSIDEIRAYIETITSVGTTTNTGNSIPSVSAGLDYIIPARTPFELIAVGSDSDNGNVLTYSWEEFDIGSSASLTTMDNGSSPLFRTWNPTTNPTRTFPRLSNLLNNSTPTGEKLPTVAWTQMDFRVVVRDNSAGGGGVSSDDMYVQVIANSTGFSITSQNSASSWGGLSSQTISWNVAGTTASPINAANVDIYFSTDGGLTFPTLLAAATPNDGSQVITVPNVATSLGRIKVKASGNIFFDVNNANINVVPSPTVNLTGPIGDIPEGDTGTSTANFVLTLTSVPTSTVTVNYTTTSTGFSNPASAGSDYTTVSGTATFIAGQTTFPIPVTIFGDRFTEGIEQFGLELSTPNGLQLGTSSLVASISDDDAFALGRPIDFGTLLSPVEVGATGFSEGAYATAIGLGWTSSSDMIATQLSFGSDLARDMVLNTTGNFRIDLPNGNYQVEAIIGIVDLQVQRSDIAASFANFTVVVEGTPYVLSLSPGTMVTQSFGATVTDGALDIGTDSGFVRRRARLSGLVVTSVASRDYVNTAGEFDSKAFGGLVSTTIPVPEGWVYGNERQHQQLDQSHSGTTQTFNSLDDRLVLAGSVTSALVVSVNREFKVQIADHYRPRIGAQDSVQRLAGDLLKKTDAHWRDNAFVCLDISFA